MGQSFFLACISLEKDKERRADMERQAEALGLTIEFVTGLDARQGFDLSATGYRPEKRRWIGNPLLPGEIGCSESHIRAWSRFCETGADYGVILEDDADILPGFSEAVEAIITETSGWDIIRLEARKSGRLTDFSWPVSSGHNLIIPKNFTLGMAGILLTRPGAEKALRYMRRGYWSSVDYQIGQVHRSELIFLQISPVIISERQTTSSIGERDWKKPDEVRSSSKRNFIQKRLNALDRAWASLRRRHLAKHWKERLNMRQRT